MSASTSAHTTRRRTLRVAAAALTAAAALSLTACSGSDAAASKPGSQPGAGASTAAEAGGAGSAEAGGADTAGGAQGGGAQAGKAKPGSEGEGTSSRGGSGGSASSRAGSGSGAAKGGGKGKFCRTSELTMEAVDSSPDQKVGDVTVQMTNKSGRTCSVTGFAGVDLKDADGTSAPVHRGGEQPRITDLKPGGTATFSISYPVDSSGDSLVSPTNIIVTPPNETHSVSLKWPSDALKPAGPYDEKIKVHPVGIAN
ncbi:DUF4232 domain-containing protein [Streptomyces albofaciens JCM 4342]|uniref:DUF4232 domain-containing protein n=1 Tax=Streptomyces albofaciens TaxID=66866 RepID=UPI00123904C6|nr:DUF4232 domain-containing protein [Streptomyces albofaciens]KAA6214932.1 DUF4232 domain-containing protein [Streptomyces albofaciens JCM 4342]